MKKTAQQTPRGKPHTSSQKYLQPTTPVKFEPRDYADSGLSTEQILQFKGAFEMFDPQGDGLVEIAQMKEAFINLGFQNQSKFVTRLLDSLDRKNNGTIDFSEFLKIATFRLSQDSSKADSNTVFTGLDTTHSRKFTIYDLKDTIRDLGEDMDTEQIENMFRKADTDSDGYVTEQDFYNIVSRKIYDEVPQDNNRTSVKALSTAGKRTSRY